MFIEPNIASDLVNKGDRVFAAWGLMVYWGRQMINSQIIIAKLHCAYSVPGSILIVLKFFI